MRRILCKVSLGVAFPCQPVDLISGECHRSRSKKSETPISCDGKNSASTHHALKLPAGKILVGREGCRFTYPRWLMWGQSQLPYSIGGCRKRLVVVSLNCMSMINSERRTRGRTTKGIVAKR